MATDDLNLSSLDGIRCLACFWITLLHYHLFAGAAQFPLNSSCLEYIRNFPILGFIVNASMAVDVFWILSGFLCQYQLLKHFNTANNKRTYGKIFYFFINRLLRLYPLYLVNTLMTYTIVFSFECSTISDLLPALFFMQYRSNSVENAAAGVCSLGGWTVNVDVHGYLVIIYLFFSNINTKKTLLYIMYGMFILATMNCIYTAYKYDTHGPPGSVMMYGIELNDWSRTEKMKAAINDTSVTDNWPDLRDFYPNIDYDSPAIEDLIQTNKRFLFHQYFTSIDRHGSSIFLGNILALNLRSKSYKQQSWMRVIGKLLIVFCCYFMVCYYGVFYIMNPFYIALQDKIFAVGTYFVLDLLLTMNVEHNVVNKCIFMCFSNRIWKFVSKFTYAIYFFHIMVLFAFVYNIDPLSADIENGGIGCDNYGFIYIFKQTSKIFCVTLVVSIILHYIIEYPFEILRYKYIRPKYVKIKKQNVKQD